MKNISFVEVDGDIYPIGSDFYEYLQDETSDTLDVELDGSVVRLEAKNGDLEEYDIEEVAQNNPGRWSNVFEYAGIEPVDERIIELTEELPGVVSLADWR